MDSGEATEVSPKGCPRWRQRNHTEIDSGDNRAFCRNDPFELCNFKGNPLWNNTEYAAYVLCDAVVTPFVRQRVSALLLSTEASSQD